MTLKLSLIVATYNRASTLEPMLQSIAAQSCDTTLWECIIVDNNSSDNTSEVLNEFVAQHPHLNIKAVKESRQGLSHARNCGIESSVAPLIAIIDDDEEVEPSYIRSYIDFFESNPVAAVGGGAIITKYIDGARPKWMTRLCEIAIANPIDESARSYLFARGRIPGGGNMVLRRTLIERYGAFDPQLGRCGTTLVGSEESNLFARLRRGGEQIWFIPRASIQHRIGSEKLELGYLRRLWFNIGRSQLLRARIEGVSDVLILYRELFKWGVTLLLQLFYLLTLRPVKGLYLVRMRWNISKGIVSALR